MDAKVFLIIGLGKAAGDNCVSSDGIAGTAGLLTEAAEGIRAFLATVGDEAVEKRISFVAALGDASPATAASNCGNWVGGGTYKLGSVV